LLALAAATLGAIGSVTVSQDKAAAQAAAPAQAKPGKSSANGAEIDANREGELLAFVQAHHPELGELLRQLKPMKVSEYQTALRALDRDVRRLDQLRKKSPTRYEPELSVWASRSRVRLLAARLSMEQDEELRQQLRSELRELRRRELGVLQLEIETVRQNLEKQQRRLEQLERQSEELQGEDEEWVERKLSALENKKDPGVTPKAEKPGNGKSKNDATLKFQ
jgi:chromosome segregation ATPase